MVKARRRLDFGASEPVAKRLRSMERHIAFNTGETKIISRNITTAVAANALTFLEFTSIGQGTGVNARIGNKIRLLRAECRGFAGPNLDFYIISSSSSRAPVIADFALSGGAYMLNNLYNSPFTEWVHKGTVNNQYSTVSNPIKIFKSFPMGMVTKYTNTGGSDGEKNRLFLVVVNRDTVSHSVDINTRTWYRDS